MKPLRSSRSCLSRSEFPGCLWGLILVFAAGGCSVSRTPVENGPALISQEDQIFDKRFRDISFKEINLEHFWKNGNTGTPREPVVLTNQTISDLSESIKDGVVNIYTRRIEERDAKFGISPNDLLPIKIPLVSTLLDIIPFQVPIPYRTEGFSLGSGFIINEEGYILTNAHVINNATDIRVVLSEGREEYPARIIGIDRLTDSALIKMEANALLTVLPLGSSDELRTGEMVIAVGNPLGLKHTVTSGLVSAKERVTPQGNVNVDFLQTDSAINPGSSGGPLLNLYGEVVGINTALLQKAQLIGFAVPIDTIKAVMPMLVLGKTERGWFGAQAGPLTLQKAVELDYPNDGGVLVTGVEKESPAEQAGLKPNDIIVSLNGNETKNFIVFRRQVIGLAPQTQLALKVYREGKILDVSSTLLQKSSVQTP